MPKSTDKFLLNFDVEGFFDELRRQQARAAHYEATRPITAKDEQIARSRRARGMSYNKRALGEA